MLGLGIRKKIRKIKKLSLEYASYGLAIREKGENLLAQGGECALYLY